MGRYPEVRRLLARNDVNVCTISIVAGILTKENKKTLLREIRGKTQRQVHVIASGYRPERTIRDRVRPVAVIKPTRAHTPSTTSPNNASTDDVVRSRAFEKWQEIYRRSGGKKLTTAAGVPLGSAEGGTATRLDVTDGGEATPVKTECVAANESTFIIEQQFELGFAVSAEFMKKLDEVKALLSNRYPAGIEFEQLFEAVIDEFIDRHSPKRKQARREQRKQKRDAKSTAQVAAMQPSKRNQVTTSTANSRPPRGKSDRDKRCKQQGSKRKRTRYVSPATKDKVFARDRGKCTYVGANGRRCNATWGLQIDHMEPYTRGGSNRANNLRLLCGKHNRIEAERILGVGIGTRRSKRE
jgi:5-methylcytosine-specific restriction endonuclease McrA